MTTSKTNSSIVNTINAVAENIFYNKEGVENISISTSVINDEQKSDTVTATGKNKIDTITTSTTDSIENVNSKLIKTNQESTKILLFNNKILNNDINKSTVIHKIEKCERNNENFQKNEMEKISQTEKCGNIKLDENNFISEEDNHDVIALQNDKENLKKSKIIGRNFQAKVPTEINLTAKLSENNKNLKPLRSSSISSSSTTTITDSDHSEKDSVKVLQNQNNSNVSTHNNDKSKRHDFEINKNEFVPNSHDGSYTNSNFVMDLSSNSNYNINVSCGDTGAENGETEESSGYGGGIIFNTSDIESHVVPVDPSSFSSNITSPVPPIKRRKRSNWNSETEKAFVKYWQQYYAELKKSKRTSIVYQKIADKLNKFGLSLTSRDVQVKTHNMTQKYRHERKLIYQADGKPSNWPVYNEVHELIGHLYKDDAKLETTSSKDEIIKPDKFTAGPSSPKIARIEPDIPHLEVLKSLGQFGALSHLSSLGHFAPFSHLGAFGAYDNLTIKREDEEEDYVMDKDINHAPDSPNSSSTSDNGAHISNYDNDNNTSIAYEKRNNFIYNDNMPSIINSYNLNSNKSAQDHTIVVTTNTDTIANTITTTKATATANAVTTTSINTTTTTATTSATGTAINSTIANNNDNFQDFDNIKKIKKRNLNREILDEIKKLNKCAREDSEYSNKLIAEANQIELKKLSVIEEYVRRSLQIQEKMLEIEIQRGNVN